MDKLSLTVVRARPAGSNTDTMICATVRVATEPIQNLAVRGKRSSSYPQF
jgi:hypothetical protein